MEGGCVKDYVRRRGRIRRVALALARKRVECAFHAALANDILRTEVEAEAGDLFCHESVTRSEPTVSTV